MKRPHVTILLPVDPARAFRLSEHPDAFRRLVPGARRVRRFDARWPEPGTRIDHTVGIPPLVVRDRTEVMAEEPPTLLRLAAHVWPLGRLTVEFRLEPAPEGARLTVMEDPVAGPVTWPVVRDMTRALLRLRNMVICRRYRRIIEQMERQCGGT